MSVKAGIIGCGYMGRYHIKKSYELDTLDITACYDSDKEAGTKFSEKYGIKYYPSKEDFLNDPEIQLVFICTPNHVHADLAIDCLNAGKHVMVEKPVALNSEELERIIKAAEDNKKIFTTHQNRRWDEDFLAVKRVVESGEIGNITSINSSVYGERGVCFGWRADPNAGGGMLYDWGIHLIDQMLYLFQNHKVTSVYARKQSILTPAVDDSFMIQMKYDNDLFGVIKVGTFSLRRVPRWFVYGDRGTLKIKDFTSTNGSMARIREDIKGFDSVFGKSNIGPSRTMAPLHPEYIEDLELPKVETDPMEYHRNLIAAVEGKENAYVDYASMRRAMKIVDLAFKSAENNEVIHEIV